MKPPIPYQSPKWTVFKVTEPPTEEASKSAPCSEVTIEFESRDALLAALCEKTFGAKPTYQNAKADD